MKTRIRFTGTVALLAAIACGDTGAAAESCPADRDAGSPSLDEMTWRRLNAVYEDLAEERFDDARADLSKMLGRAGRNRYLEAVLNQAMGQVEWARGNYSGARGYIETAVELDSLPDAAHFALLYQLVQLYYLQGRYDDALERLNAWFCHVPLEQLSALNYVLKASIHAQQAQYPDVLQAIDRAIATGPGPEESWYRLKLAAHFELEQYGEAAETLEIMVGSWPDRRSHWVQLSQTWYRMGRDDRALAVLALAYRNGLLDRQSDFLFLSSLYNHSEVPFKAAQVLEQGILQGVVEASEPHRTRLADTWYRADEMERSLEAYAAASLAATDGTVDLRRGFILVELERWQQAMEALDLALDKGGLDDRQNGEAFLLRGVARFHLGRLKDAGDDWNRAAQYERTRDSARQWINHLREAKRRRAS